MIAAMRMTTFWNAIEDLIGAATSQREWSEILGAEWAPAATLLRPTDEKAEELVCRKGCVDGYARRVVPMVDGRLRAECGNPSPICESVVLDKAEVNILTLDLKKLAKVLIRALKLVGEPDKASLGHAAFLGRYEVSAGRGFPVFLYLPQHVFGLDAEAFDPIEASPTGPRLVLVPTRRCTSSPDIKRLVRHQATILTLDETFQWDSRRGLSLTGDPASLFASLLGSIQSADQGKSPAITLPSKTPWSAISIEFDNPELAILRGPGVQRSFSPADLDMADKRNGRARQPWIWLRALAVHSGRMPTGKSSAQKHKQFVSEKLMTFTGLATDPIEYDEGHYIAKFKVTGAGLKQGQSGASRRNFVDGH
ncbi:MAG: hypothetical protein ABF308_13640 [Phaeobacter gallaeciensis]